MSAPDFLGVRGDLRADGHSCESCGLPLDASRDIRRVRGPIESDTGEVQPGTLVEFVAGVCVCAFRWALLWRVDL